MHKTRYRTLEEARSRAQAYVWKRGRKHLIVMQTNMGGSDVITMSALQEEQPPKLRLLLLCFCLLAAEAAILLWLPGPVLLVLQPLHFRFIPLQSRGENWVSWQGLVTDCLLVFGDICRAVFVRYSK
jgi:hypothetical protein